MKITEPKVSIIEERLAEGLRRRAFSRFQKQMSAGPVPKRSSRLPVAGAMICLSQPNEGGEHAGVHYESVREAALTPTAQTRSS